MTEPITAQIKAEYDALTSGIGVAALRPQTWIELTGEDRLTLLHNLCTNDINRLEPQTGCEAFLTDVRGKVLGHVIVLCGPQSVTIETTGGQAESIVQHLDRYIIREDVQVHDRSGQWSELLLGGSAVVQRLPSVVGTALPRHTLDHVSVQIAGIPAILCQFDVIHPHSYLIGCLSADQDQVINTLKHLGAVTCSHEAVEMVRIESGWPVYGRDITASNLPQEIGRDEQTISFTKGCYLGQETVARIDALGHVNQMLVGVAFQGSDCPAAGLELLHDNAPVGMVTSATHSPRLGKPLSMAYVRREHHQIGTKLDSSAGVAEVIRLPLTT